MVAEDDEISYALFETILLNENFELLHANNGQEAIVLAEKHPDIDLILMDIKMPVMDGYKATKEIRKTNKEMPVIAQTAYVLPGDREKALNAGCNDYVAKPLRKSELLKKLNEYMKL